MVEKKVATFQERFSELVESSPKSRSTIASEFGVAKQTISAWTTGQSSPRLPVITLLAEYFGVNSNWLLGFDVPRTVSNHWHKKEKPDYPYEDSDSSSDEKYLIVTFRSLPDAGKQYLLQQTQIAKITFGEKSSSFLPDQEAK